MKKLLIFTFVFCSFFLFTKSTFADTLVQPLSNPTSVSSDGNTWNNPSNMTMDDGNDATCTGNSDCGVPPWNFGFGTNVITGLNTFQSIVITVVGYHSGGGGGITAALNSNGSPTACSGGDTGGTSNTIPYTSTMYPSTYYLTIPAGSVTNAEINSGNYCITLFLSNNSGGTWNIDYVAAQIKTSIPQSTLSLSDVVASQGAQFVSFNASGDTKFTQAGEMCKVTLAEYNISDPATPTLTNGSIASILLNANVPRTTTGYQGNSVYLGYGYTSTNSSWEADGIQVPFFNTANSDIRAYTSCYHQTINSDGSLSAPIYDLQQQGFDSTLNGTATFNPSLIATPSALQGLPQNTVIDCGSNVICQFEQWLISTFTAVFGINSTLATDNFSDINSLLSNKAPFAYVISAFGTDFSPTGTTSAVPTLSIPFSISGDSYVSNTIPTINYSDSSNNIVSNFGGYFRNFMMIALWFAFIFYLVARIRNIL